MEQRRGKGRKKQRSEARGPRSGKEARSRELDVGWVEGSLIGWVSFFSEHGIKDIERCLGERNPSTRVKRIPACQSLVRRAGRITNKASGSPQAIGHLRRQFVGLRRSFARRLYKPRPRNLYQVFVSNSGACNPDSFHRTGGINGHWVS